MKRSASIGIATASLVMILALTSAHALSVTPGGATWTSNTLLATPNAITGIPGLTLAYRSILGVEDGSFSTSYSTSFPATGSQFTLTYGSGSSITCPTCVLVVTRGLLGPVNPAKYLYNIGTWNGTDQITGTGFWPPDNQLPRIASVAIFRADPVVGAPEPASLLLLGAGLVGLGIWKRNANKV